MKSFQLKVMYSCRDVQNRKIPIQFSTSDVTYQNLIGCLRPSGKLLLKTFRCACNGGKELSEKIIVLA